MWMFQVFATIGNQAENKNLHNSVFYLILSKNVGLYIIKKNRALRKHVTKTKDAHTLVVLGYII